MRAISRLSMVVAGALAVFYLWMSINAFNPRLGSVGFRLLLGAGGIGAGWALVVAASVVRRSPKFSLGAGALGSLAGAALFVPLVGDLLAIALVALTILLMVLLGINLRSGRAGGRRL